MQTRVRAIPAPDRSVRGAMCLALAGLIVSVSAGCKTQTAKQIREEIEKEVLQEQAAKVRSDVQDRDDAQLIADRQILLRQERANRKARAQQALAEKKPELALSLIDEIFNEQPTEEVRRDPVTGIERTLTILPPPISQGEKALLRELQGLAYADRGEKDQAIASFKEAVELDRSLRIARKNLGRLYFSKLQFEEALKYWQLELEDGYWDADILYFIGQAHYELFKRDRDRRRLDAARFAFQGTLVKDPNNIKSRRWLAVLEYESGRYAEAIRLLEGIRNEYPLDQVYLELLAESYKKLEQFDRATDAFELAARLSSGEPKKSLCENLANLYAKRGMPGTAADWMIRASRGDMEKTAATDRLFIGQLLAEAGRLEEARPWLASLKETDRGYVDAQSAIAGMYRDLDENSALEAFEHIRRARPSDAFAHLSAGDIYLDRKQYDRAQEAYQRVSELDGTRADGLAGLAEVAYAKKELELAADYYRKAVKERDDRRFVVALREIEEEIKIKEETRKASAESEANSTAEDSSSGDSSSGESSVGDSSLGEGGGGADYSAASGAEVAGKPPSGSGGGAQGSKGARGARGARANGLPRMSMSPAVALRAAAVVKLLAGAGGTPWPWTALRAAAFVKILASGAPR